MSQKANLIMSLSYLKLFNGSPLTSGESSDFLRCHPTPFRNRACLLLQLVSPYSPSLPLQMCNNTQFPKNTLIVQLSNPPLTSSWLVPIHTPHLHLQGSSSKMLNPQSAGRAENPPESCSQRSPSTSRGSHCIQIVEWFVCLHYWPVLSNPQKNWWGLIVPSYRLRNQDVEVTYLSHLISGGEKNPKTLYLPFTITLRSHPSI